MQGRLRIQFKRLRDSLSKLLISIVQRVSNKIMEIRERVQMALRANEYYQTMEAHMAPQYLPQWVPCQFIHKSRSNKKVIKCYRKAKVI